MKKAVIRSGQLELSLLTLGARIIGLKYRGMELALSYPDTIDYESDPFYLGASVGPIANRMANASLRINDQTYHLPANEGANCLHSGGVGFDKHEWAITDQSDTSVTFELDYRLEAIGMQGLLNIRAIYTLVENTLQIDYQTKCDTQTYINPTNHVYLNLSGKSLAGKARDISDHAFKLYGQNYVGVNQNNIPNGQLHGFHAPLNYRLSNTDTFDGLVDHHFNIKNDDLAQAEQIALMLEAKSERSNITLQVSGNSHGYQFYTGRFLSEPFLPSGGFCVETQYAPDAINQPHLYSPLLSAGVERKQTTFFEFSGGLESGDLESRGLEK